MYQGCALTVPCGPLLLSDFKVSIFHRNHMLGTLDSTSSEHRAPFYYLTT